MATSASEDAPSPTPPSPEPLSPEWCEGHFDPLSPELGRDPHPTLAYLRERCPVPHSQDRGGFWLVTRYDLGRRLAEEPAH